MWDPPRGRSEHSGLLPTIDILGSKIGLLQRPVRKGLSKNHAVPISESLEGAAVAEDYSNQLAVRHQVRQVLLAALARVGIWGKADRVKVVAYGFRQDGDFVLARGCADNRDDRRAKR